MIHCCCTTSCTYCFTITGCGVHVGSGYTVTLKNGFGTTVGTATTDSSGVACITVPTPVTGGTYTAVVAVPGGSAYVGRTLNVTTPNCAGAGTNAGTIALNPAGSNTCSDCAPGYPVTNNLTLSGWTGSSSPTTTNGSTWTVVMPYVDCPPDCPDPSGGPAGPAVVTVDFNFFCNGTTGLYNLIVSWFVYTAGPGAPSYDHCPHPDGLGAATRVWVGFVASSISTGPIMVTFGTTAYSATPGTVNTGSPVADPFIKLLCASGTRSFTVTAT